MKKFIVLLLVGAAAFVSRDASAQVYSQNAVGFLNIQGVFHENNQLANGFFDVFMDLLADNGAHLVTSETNNNVLASNGLAYINLSIPAHTGLSPTQELYLVLSIRRSGTSNAFTALSPRQRVVPSLLSTWAFHAEHAEEARRLTQPLPPNLVTSVLDSALSSNVALLNGNPKFVTPIEAPLLRGLTDGVIWAFNSAITVSNSTSGMRFSNANGFTFGSQVTVNGPVFAQAFVQTSSRRFKNDVTPIEQPLEKISRLQGVRFKWNERNGGKKDVGFIAEDVAQVIPEVVTWEEDGQNARGVNYDHLVAVAIEGIKAQQSQIQTLEREKAELKESLTAVQTRLERLSRQLDSLKAH